MNFFTNYLPFVLVSAVLYGLFFSYNKQSPLIIPLPLNSGDQSIQVRFIASPTTQAEVEIEKTIDDIEPPITKPVTKPIVKPITTPITEPKAKITLKPQLTATSQSQVQIFTPELVKTELTKPGLSKTELSEQELTTQELFSESAEPKINSSTPPRESVTEAIVTTAAEVIPTATTTAKTTKPVTKTIQQSDSNKPVFKKQPMTESASPASSVQQQGVLQKAIVVSGNRPSYPKRAILRNQQGRVVVKLTVSMQGKPKKTEVITSSGHSILDDAVIDFIEDELFMPALKGNEKVTSEQVFAFRFQLK